MATISKNQFFGGLREGLGRVWGAFKGLWEGFGEHLGGFGEGLGRVLVGFGMDLGDVSQGFSIARLLRLCSSRCLGFWGQVGQMFVVFYFYSYIFLSL